MNNFNLEDTIREALADAGYVAGDSGYEFSTGIRDIEFHNKKTDDTYVVTIQLREKVEEPNEWKNLYEQLN